MNTLTLHQEPQALSQFEFCEDHDRQRLSHLALQIASNIEVAHHLILPKGQTGNRASKLRMLALLTFSYAAGHYDSNEIENVASIDPIVRDLSENMPVTGDEIRCFRRHFRDLLKECLSQALCRAWRFGIWSAFSMPPCATSTPCIFNVSVSETGIELMFERIAEDRITYAVRRDSMALDD